MTDTDARSLTKQIGKAVIAKARDEHSKIVELFEEIIANTEYLEMWDEAIAENDFRNTVADIQTMIDATNATAIS